MPDDITPSATNTPAVNAAPTPALAATPEPLAGDGAETPISLEEAKKLRSESANMRKRLKAYEDAEEQAKTAALSEVEKANKQVADLQKKYESAQKQIVSSHIQLTAQKTGVRNPELIAGAIGHLLEYDEEGMPTNLEKVLGDLKKSDPYLFADAAQPASPTQQRPPQTPPNNPGRSQIVSPGNAPQGKRPSLFDPNLWKK